MIHKSIGTRPKGSMKYVGGLSTLFSFSKVLQRNPYNLYVSARNMDYMYQVDNSPITDYGQAVGYVTNLVNNQRIPLTNPVTYLPNHDQLVVNFGALVVAANTPMHLFVDSDIGVVHQQAIPEEDLSLDLQVTLQRDSRIIYLFGKYSTKEIEQIKNILSLDKGYLVPEFSPKHLFLNGEQGFWLDPNDLSTMFQDAAGTVLVAEIGQPVGLILDKSGRGNHAMQETSAKRPLLKKSDVLLKLGFDGIDDGLLIPNFDFTHTDEVTVYAKLKKNTQIVGAVVELRNLNAVGAARFTLQAPLTGSSYGFSVYGTTTQLPDGSNSSPTYIYIRPVDDLAIQKVIASGSISESMQSMEINGTVLSSDKSVGTGNFAKDTLYIGNRGNTARFLDGDLFELIVVDRLLTAQEYTALKAWRNEYS